MTGYYNIIILVQYCNTPFFVKSESPQLFIGAFIQMSRQRGNSLFGLTKDALEVVAMDGKAALAHVNLDGVRTLKLTHLKPEFQNLFIFIQNFPGLSERVYKVQGGGVHKV